MGSRINKVLSFYSCFRRKEYLRQKHSGVSKVTDKEKILIQSLQSVCSLLYF